MRVSKTTSAGTTAVGKRPGGGNAGGGGFRVDGGTDAAPAQRTGGVQAAQPMDGLLALQEVPDPLKGKKKAVRRANDMLDLLEEIRIDLLAGVLPNNRLSSLLTLVRAQRDTVHDPRLAHVLDEIELRARVELAKAGHTV